MKTQLQQGTHTHSGIQKHSFQVELRSASQEERWCAIRSKIQHYLTRR